MTTEWMTDETVQVHVPVTVTMELPADLSFDEAQAEARSVIAYALEMDGRIVLVTDALAAVLLDRRETA